MNSIGSNSAQKAQVHAENYVRPHPRSLICAEAPRHLNN
jgi:hypothetical protein